MIDDHEMPLPFRNVELSQAPDLFLRMKEVNAHAVNQVLSAACMYTFGLWLLFITTLFTLSKWL